jgi:iron complex transport system ATP-binding protein
MTATLFGAYGITYRVRGRDAPVLDEVSLEVDRGEILALLGPNGSGKSTFLKLVTGILPLRPGTGVVRYQDADFLSTEPASRARCVVYVGSDLRSEFPMTAMELVGLARGSRSHGIFRRLDAADSTAIRWAMETCFCWEMRNRDLATLSGGERQLVMLARALAQGVRVLALDETLSRMDLHHQAAVGKMLRAVARERGLAVVLVAHDLNLASEWADTCVLLNRGRRVAHGRVEEVITERNLRALYPGAPLVIGKNPASGTPQVFFGR